MKIDPSEEQIRGTWVRDGNRARGDASCERIKELISNHLLELARDHTGWETLFVDPDDGRLWERTYPQGHMHGGGPPMLTHLSEEEAREKYGDEVLIRARRA